ncbi:MAG: putative peptidase [Chlamydiae bacterium]|nr:putative peptidase [Chlamydiota bacterium]
MRSKPSSPTHEARLKRLVLGMKRRALAALVIEDPVDIFYLTGFHASLATLILTPSSGKLFVDGRYRQKATEVVAFPIGEYGLKAVESFFARLSGKKVGFDSGKSSYERALALRRCARQGGALLVPISEPLKRVRVIKDGPEVAALKKSAKLNQKAYEHVLTLLKPGVTEREVARSLEIFALENGAEKLSFDPIIAFGKGSALPHYSPGDVKLKASDIILIDMGVMVDQYASDMTRVVLPKKCPPEMQKIYDTVIGAYEAAAAICRPGTKMGALDRAARGVMKKAGLEKLFIHGLGHGVGLEVHEFPRIKFDGIDRNVILEPGMVLTIEPGLYLPGKGGVRYENTVIVTPRGHTNLYTC